MKRLLPTLRSRTLYGQVLGIDKAGSIRFVSHEGGEPVIHPLGAMRAVRLHKRNPAPVPRTGMVLLRSGVMIPGNVRKTDGRSLEISSPLFESRIKVSLTRVQAVRFAKLPAADEGGFQKYVNNPKEDKDLLYFTTEDRIVQRSVTESIRMVQKALRSPSQLPSSRCCMLMCISTLPSTSMACSFYDIPPMRLF